MNLKWQKFRRVRRKQSVFFYKNFIALLKTQNPGFEYRRSVTTSGDQSINLRAKKVRLLKMRWEMSAEWNIWEIYFKYFQGWGAYKWILGKNYLLALKKIIPEWRINMLTKFIYDLYGGRKLNGSTTLFAFFETVYSWHPRNHLFLVIKMVLRWQATSRFLFGI